MASYQPVTKEIVEQLEKIAPGRVYFGDDVNPDYGRDEMPIYGTRVPEASVDAMTTEEIAAVMKLCYENNIPVTTRGAGTGLVGGCVPVMGGVVIATTKMNKILGYDLDNYTVTVFSPRTVVTGFVRENPPHGTIRCNRHGVGTRHAWQPVARSRHDRVRVSGR